MLKDACTSVTKFLHMNSQQTLFGHLQALFPGLFCSRGPPLILLRLLLLSQLPPSLLPTLFQFLISQTFQMLQDRHLHH